MHGRDRGRRQIADHRKMRVVGVEMQNVKILDSLANMLDLQHIVGGRITDLREPERLRRAGDELRRGFRAAAREKRHFMALAHQLFGEIGDDPLRASIKRRRHAFHQRRDLRNFHRQSRYCRQAAKPRAPHRGSDRSLPAEATIAEISLHPET